MSTNAFSEDDEETWKLLASSSSEPVSDVGQRLNSLAGRFEEDGHDSPFWHQLLSTLHSKGFSYSDSTMASLKKPQGSVKAPVAFESEAGKQHLEATSALLGISNDRAVQVTLNALRSFDSDGSQFQSLLGSRDFLWKTLLHHQQQRLARLGTVAECLRIEQGTEAPNFQEVQVFLESLDSIYKDEDRYRGLFRRLLVTACEPIRSPNRDQLEPAKKLRADLGLDTSKERAWDEFCGSIAQELRMQQIREREGSMEGLLVLLYDRINGGVRRPDFALILLAFSSTEFFTVGRNKASERLTQLAGLVVAECTALWRVMDATLTWATRHPLLLGMSSSGHPIEAKNQIQQICNMFMDVGDNATEINNSDAPKSLGMLAFGLLLRLAHTSFQSSSPEQDAEAVSESFGTLGMDMANEANEKAGAFDYLSVVLDNLASTPYSKRSSASHDQLYDWQYSPKKKAMLLEDDRMATNAASDTTAYTSIAREILAACIAAFEDVSILDIGQSTSCENIGMLCGLGSKIFQNNPLHCEQFWTDWEVYSDGSTAAFPICKLLDVSHKMTVAAHEAHAANKITAEFLVQAAAPFFQLVSSLCHTSELVGTITAALLPGLISRVLICCRPESSGLGRYNDAFQQNRLALLTAIGRLTRFGNSKECLDQIRASLEDRTLDVRSMQGPRIISRLICNEAEDVLEPILSIMAHLLDGAPHEWAMLLSLEIMECRDAKRITLARCLSPGKATVHAAALVLAELIEHLTSVVFSPSTNDHDTIAFLFCSTDSLHSAAASLAASLSDQSFSDPGPFSFETAQTILQSFTNFLKLIRSVIRLHKSETVRNKGIEARDSIIRALAESTGVGQAIIYYATAPVSLSLCIKLQGALQDRSVLKHLSAVALEDTDIAHKYGAWQSYLHPNQGNESNQLAKQFLLEAMYNLKSEDIDFDGIVARNWTGVYELTACIDTAFAALRLLSQWASHAEDILSTFVDDLESTPRPLTGELKDFVENMSPHRLLSSSAVAPCPCRQDGTLASIWESASISNLELLLPYLALPAAADPELVKVIPSSTLLDLLHSCICHVASICPREMVADTILFQTLFRNSRFSQLIRASIEKALDASKNENQHEQVHNALLLDGVFSLRLLASCCGCSAAVADTILHPQGESVIRTLISAAMEVKSLLNSGNVGLLKDTIEVSKLRIATGCMAVLASLWQTVRMSQSTKNVPRLIDAVNGNDSFITELVGIVSSYALAEDLEGRMALSNMAGYCYGVLKCFVALALRLLTAEAAYESGGGNSTNVALENFLLRDFVRSERLIDAVGFKRSTNAFDIGQSLDFGIIQSEAILESFPAESVTALLPFYFFDGNAFDVATASQWVRPSCEGQGCGANETMVDVSVAHNLCIADLQLIKAWSSFSEIAEMFTRARANEKISPGRAFGFVEETIRALQAVLTAASRAQVENTTSSNRYLEQIPHTLAELLLFFLDREARYAQFEARPSQEVQVSALEMVINSCELALTTLPTSASSMVKHRKSLEGAILASAVACLGLLDDSNGRATTPELGGRLYQCHKSLWRVNCRAINTLGSFRKGRTPEVGLEEICSPLLISISLFSSLLSRNHGHTQDELVYIKAIADLLPVYEVPQILLEQAMSISAEAETILLTGCELSASESRRVDKLLALVQGILDLLCFISEKGSMDLLALFPRAKLAQLLVRNPLFNIVLSNEQAAMPRGYRLAAFATKEKNSNLKIGEADPTHVIWISSIRILTSAMHISTKDRTWRFVFVDMAMEFLVLYRTNLLSTLNACGYRLTRRGLAETRAILGLIAAVCKRDIRDYCQRANNDLIVDLVSCAKFVIAALSKFLGSSGTARELFLCIERHNAESENLSGFNQEKPPLRHPLMEDGTPGAKHEAVKFSHYASRCYQRVSANDFKTCSTFSDRFVSLSRANDSSESDLERASRNAVTNDFAVAMEEMAAICVSEAISVIWRAHPTSSSFRTVSNGERESADLMRHVKENAIIGFYPFESSIMLHGQSGIQAMFDSLHFGRVRSADTINRTWVVAPLEFNGLESDPAETTWTIRIGQLAGYENPSSRKTVSSYLPAPNSMSELEATSNKLCLGHLVLILRWCHQESLFCQNGFIHPQTKRLSEQVSVLLGAELSIHNEIGSRVNATAESKLQADAQVFELFADSTEAYDERDELSPIDGRLKRIIATSAWEALRPQVVLDLKRFWKERREKEQRRSEKRSLSQDTWYNPRKGPSQKSAFRAFR